MDLCPCASGKAFAECCGPYLSGTSDAPTAEALMRSRYSAFATENIDYLETTLAMEKRKSFDREATANWARSSEWKGLRILAVRDGKETDKQGIVEFVADFCEKGQFYQHRETSRFERREEKWYYVEGARGALPVHSDKTGRNDPCPCGSGKKFKKCCGAGENKRT
ncbi:MAG: YchJ family protein [Alphaproteobacteria bacterium]|nr:YchJ family protein [Alphaproteobacteria bacterium]